MAKNAEIVNDEVAEEAPVAPQAQAQAQAQERKPRSDAQKAAFKRCLDKRHELMQTKSVKPEIQKTLHKEKKKAELEAASAPTAPIVEPIVQKKERKVIYQDESSDSDDEPQIVIVKRKKKPAKKVIYQYESSDEEEEERKPKAKPKAQPVRKQTPRHPEPRPIAQEKPKDLPFNFIIC